LKSSEIMKSIFQSSDDISPQSIHKITPLDKIIS